MIAAMKQVGVNVARQTVRRYVIRGGIVTVLFVVGVAYRAFTGHSLNSASDDGDVAAKPVAHHAPKSAPAAPAAAQAAAPTQAATAGSPFTPQGIDLNAPKRAAQNAVAAENAQLAAQTGQAVPTRTPAQPQTQAPVSGPGSAPSASGALTPSGALEMPTPGKLGAPVTRETFAYDGVGRRDPFFSLILTDDLRPLLADLRLVGILYEASGRRTVAVMRDLQTNAQYRVTTGTTLGRMRVSQIRPRAVIFSVDEFGLSRQDSLVWSDTTQVRN